MITARRLLPSLLAMLVLFQRGYAQSQDRFDHWQHRDLFPKCTSCHAAVQDEDVKRWLQEAECADCHDGVIQ
jgi:hypothetical protein